MKISARNVFGGTVTAVKPGAVTTEVDVTLPGGIVIVATVTRDSAIELGLIPGRPVKAIIKASSVLVLTEGADVRLSARNCLAGTITALTEGPVSTEVAIGLADGHTVYATICGASNPVPAWGSFSHAAAADRPRGIYMQRYITIAPQTGAYRRPSGAAHSDSMKAINSARPAAPKAA